MIVTATIHGLDETLANLRRLGTAFSTEVEAAALKKVAAPMADDLAIRIDTDHRETGLTADDIRYAVSREAERAGSAAVLIGARRRAFILSFIEFGTFRRPGAHVVAGVFRRHSADFTRKMASELSIAFKKTVAKYSRRAARRAAAA